MYLFHYFLTNISWKKNYFLKKYDIEKAFTAQRHVMKKKKKKKTSVTTMNENDFFFFLRGYWLAISTRNR